MIDLREDGSVGLIPSDHVKEANFATGRMGYREWAARTGRISPSLEDRCDHDVDQLMS